MDDTDLAIIRELTDGRVPFKEVGRRLGLAEATVRNRVRRLREAGVLDISGRVDPDSLPDHSVVMIGVRVRDMNLVRKAEEFSNLRGVVSVCVVTGRFDLMVMVVLHKDFGILEFYTQEVSKLDNIQSVETFVIYKSFNLSVSLPADGKKGENE
jgi:Lrp/AsnC family transcriptional regulator for asnA, asnC and gidA